MVLGLRRHLDVSSGPPRFRGGDTNQSALRTAKAREIAQDLLAEALQNGFPINEIRFEARPVSEGSSAEIVARIRMALRFIFKVDSTQKLVHEAQTIQRIRSDLHLPQTFRDRFPRVYALRHQATPYAYLMEEFAAEDGFRSLAQELFDSRLVDEALEIQGRYLLKEVLAAMLEGYSNSVNRRKRITLWGEEYLGRIDDRLKAAAEISPCFEARPVIVNGKSLRAWSEYLRMFEDNRHKIDALAPPFTTVVIGDPNPENVLLRYLTGVDLSTSVDVRFIDPKDWGEGDYVFDLAKLAHYIHATGPTERLPGKQVSWQLTDKGSLIIDYTLPRGVWIENLTNLVRENVITIGGVLGDTSRAKLRFDLAMSANLLGLPLNRWSKKNLRDEALVLYAEGLLWLEKFSIGLAAI